MSNVYFMSGKDDCRTPAYSIFPIEKVGLAFELIPLLDGKSKFICSCHFKKITLAKKGLVYEEVTEGDPVWIDYPANSFAWPIFSERFMALIRENTSDEDNIDWINLRVEHFGISKSYYILRFNKLHDIIDSSKTLYVENTDLIIRPCFKATAFEKIQIAAIPIANNLWKITSGLYVSEILKNMIIKHKIEGLEFSKARISKGINPLLA